MKHEIIVKIVGNWNLKRVTDCLDKLNIDYEVISQ